MSDDPPLITVLVADEQSLAIDEERVADVARRTAASQGAAGEISILLVDRERIAELNHRFLGEEGPTDVLAFPIDGPDLQNETPVLIGDVVVCPEFARDQAKEDLAGELDLLVAHGVLHLLGHDHDTEQSASRMREVEKAITGREGARAS